VRQQHIDIARDWCVIGEALYAEGEGVVKCGGNFRVAFSFAAPIVRHSLAAANMRTVEHRKERRVMKLEEAKYSVAELIDWFKKRELVVNKDYQRGGRLWPRPAKSYFIDTVLREFPFPKVYFLERLDRATKRPMREIVDGQQRIATLVEFAENEFALGQNAREYAGQYFRDLDEEGQERFYSYTVSVDVVRNADRAEILQMFRRMNAYTLPLNAAEKRHSEFFGEFKDWINAVLDEYERLLTSWNILTSRQIVRMGDAELLADIALAIEHGIVSTSPAKLAELYKQYDFEFPTRTLFDERIRSSLDVVITALSDLQDTYMTKAHVFHSLVCALIHNRWGLPDGEETTGIRTTGEFFRERDAALVSLKRLAAAHEEKDFSEFASYVTAASEGGNRAAQRAVRISWICRALNGEFAFPA